MRAGYDQSRLSQGQIEACVELTLLVVLLLIAMFFRFHNPDAVPPGLSHDELRMMQLGELIVEGARPIHWTISYSAEPLFMYILALVMPVIGFTPFGARISNRLGGLLLIPLVHLLTRRLFGRRVALVTSGVLAVTWWPVFFSRVALRGITLPLIFTAAVYCLWRGLDPNGIGEARRMATARWVWLMVGGGLMGLTWYTFTAARGLFILLPAFMAYLMLTRIPHIKQIWRAALVTLSLASLIAAPFVYDMRVNPGAPETRIKQLSGVIEELRAGDIAPFIRQAIATLEMLISTGDPNWRYNVSDRPTFDPILGIFAILGLLASILHWRQPRYSLLLLWLVLGWAPSLLTPEAPSFVRAIGSLPPTSMLPGIGAVMLWDWIARSTNRRIARLVPALLAFLLAVDGLSTLHNLFMFWPIQAQVREIYQASLTEAFQALNQSDLEGAIWVSEPFPDDRHVLLAGRILTREEIKPRWFDADRAFILPPTKGMRHYLLADFTTPDPTIFARWMGKADVVLKGKVLNQRGEAAYQVYRVEGGPWVDQELAEITSRSTAYTDLGARQPVPLPARFEGAATLLGYELANERLIPGQEVHLILYWRAHGPIYDPLSSFAHMLDEQSGVVGQYDGFDVPARYWEPEAVIAQAYRFLVSQDVSPGFHWLEVGLYNPRTMERVHVISDDGTSLSDRLLLQRVIIQ